MNRSIRSMLWLALVATPFMVNAANEREVRFYPAGGVWLQELDAARGFNSAIVQNTAVVNRGDAPATVVGVRYDVVRDGRVVLTQSLAVAEVTALASALAPMQQAGMLDALAFQFAPKRLLGDGVVLSPTPTLAPGAALLVPSQMLAFKGAASAIRVTVDFDGTVADAVGELPVRGSAAPGTMRFPLRGRWFIGAGSSLHTHHRWAVPEEFALDIARVGATGGTYADDGSAMAHYYAWGEPVLASADGEVVRAVDDQPDNLAMLRQAGEAIDAYWNRLRATQDEFLAKGGSAMAGNHVVVKHADGLYSVYAHLKPRSVSVKVGERVKAGHALGAIGSSGMSTEPHLHFHVCDAPDALNCAGIPVRFDNVELGFNDLPRQLQSGDMVIARQPRK